MNLFGGGLMSRPRGGIPGTIGISPDINGGGRNGGAPGKNGGIISGGGGKLMLFGDSTLIGDGIELIESFGNPSGIRFENKLLVKFL